MRRFNTSANRAARLREIIAGDRQTAATFTGIRMQVVTGGTDGTGTAYTPQPRQNKPACLSTAKINYTAEPTGTTAGPHYALNVNAAIVFEDEFEITVGDSSAIAIVLTADENRASGDVAITAVFEE